MLNPEFSNDLLTATASFGKCVVPGFSIPGVRSNSPVRPNHALHFSQSVKRPLQIPDAHQMVSHSSEGGRSTRP